MNRRDAIKLGAAGIAGGIAGANFAKEIAAKDKLPTWVRHIDEYGYYNLYSDWTFSEHTVIEHRSVFCDCMFMDGFLLQDGSERTEFHSCMHGDGQPVITKDPAYKNVQFITDDSFLGSESNRRFFRPVGVYGECLYVWDPWMIPASREFAQPTDDYVDGSACAFSANEVCWTTKELLGKTKHFVI